MFFHPSEDEVLKMFLITVFENIKNIISVFSKNHSYSLNLEFSVFSLFYTTKSNGEPNAFFVFLRKQFLKTQKISK